MWSKEILVMIVGPKSKPLTLDDAELAPVVNRHHVQLLWGGEHDHLQGARRIIDADNLGIVYLLQGAKESILERSQRCKFIATALIGHSCDPWVVPEDVNRGSSFLLTPFRQNGIRVFEGSLTRALVARIEHMAKQYA